jgi:hypothetical protein
VLRMLPAGMGAFFIRGVADGVAGDGTDMRPTPSPRAWRPAPFPKRRRESSLRTALLALVLFGSATPGSPHDLGTIQVYGTFLNGGIYEIDLVVDEEHVKLAQLGGPARTTHYGEIARLDGAVASHLGRFLCDLADASSVRFDGRAVRPSLEIAPPDPGTTPRPGRAVLRLRGEIPAGVRRMVWENRLPIGRYPVVLRNQGDELSIWQWADGGHPAPPFVLAAAVVPPPPAAIVAVVRRWSGRGFAQLAWSAEAIVLALAVALSSRGLTAQLLQLLALFAALEAGLLGALARSGVLAVALTLLAADNLFSRSRHGKEAGQGFGPPRRPPFHRLLLVVGCGALYGLALRGSVAAGGLPSGRGGLALAAYGVGAGLAVAAIMILAFVLLGASYRWQPWYRQRVALPGSCLAAAVAFYWSVERLL